MGHVIQITSMAYKEDKFKKYMRGHEAMAPLIWDVCILQHRDREVEMDVNLNLDHVLSFTIIDHSVFLQLFFNQVPLTKKTS